MIVLTDNDRRHLLVAIRSHSKVCGYNGVRLPKTLQVLYVALDGQEETKTDEADDKADDGGMAPHLLTYRESARRLNVSERTVRRAVQAGLLEVVRLGRATRIDPDDLEKFVESQRAGSRLGRFRVH